jgi:hypothetical protein
MSFFEAFQIGWSVVWRQFLWVATAAVFAFGVFLLPGIPRTLNHHNLGPLIVVPVGMLPVLLFAIFPRIIQRVAGLDYSGFRLVVRRPEGGVSKLAYLEALAVSSLVEIVPAVCTPFLRWFPPLRYLPVIELLFPLMVTMPLAAWVMVHFPSRNFEIEVCH